jgi:hypothetical protein
MGRRYRSPFSFGDMTRCVPVAFLFVATALLFAACDHRKALGRSQTDAEIQQTIAGTWGLVISNVEGVITYRPDGGFSGYWSNMLGPRGWRFEGEWKIVDGDLVSVLTNKSAWNFTLHGPTGTVDRVRILRLNDQELIAAFEEQTNKWTRRK